MTDKQINTCEFLNICQTDCNGTLEDTEMCHCYELYKQLKRKEQECEVLKQKLHQCWMVENSFVEQLDQLEAENKKLKATLANDECFIDGSKKCVKAFCLDEELREQLEQEKALKEMYFTYYKAKHGDIKGKFFKLEQTLSEIKEIVEKHKVTAHCDYLTDMDTILQLISKCEVKNAR